jgi:hypothetical protein
MAPLKPLLDKHFIPSSRVNLKSGPTQPSSAKIFDLAEEYDEMLNRGIHLPGEESSSSLPGGYLVF